MALAASLEARSSHPLARAILEQAEGDGVPVAPAEDVRTVPGRGLEARVGSRAIWRGSYRSAAERGFGASLPGLLRHRNRGGGTTLGAGGDEDLVHGFRAWHGWFTQHTMAGVVRPDSRRVNTVVNQNG